MNQIIMGYKAAANKFDFLQKTLILFVFVISVSAFWQPFFDPFGPAQLMLIRIFIPLIIIIYLLNNIKNKQPLFKTNFLLYPLLGYIIISFISIFFALNKEISFKYFIELFLAILGAYILYCAIDNKFLKKLILVILITHTLLSFYGILQHFNMDFFKWNTNFGGRPMGTIGNPNFFAAQLLFVLFFLLALIFFGTQNRILTVLAFLLIFFTFLYTKVVGAYIGFLAGLIVLFIIFLFLNYVYVANFVKHRLIYIIIIFLILLISILLFNKMLHDKITKTFADKKRSIVHRLLMWETSLLMIKESPVFGKGIGNYRLYYPLYQAKLLNNPNNKHYDYVVTWMPHQNYLLIASETGLFGLFMFIFAIMYFYRSSWKIIFVNKTRDPIPIGIITGITAILGASFFNTFYNIPSTTIYFFFFLFVLNNYNNQETQKFFYLKSGHIKIIIFILSIILFFNTIADSKTIISNINLKHANRYAKNKNYIKAIEYYENIIKLKPVELCPQMNVAHYYFAAEAYREIGNFNKAKEYYYEDLKLNPYCPEINNMLGALLGQLGNIDEAIKKLELATYVAPHYEAAYINLATAYFVKKDYISSKKLIKKYIELNGETQLFNDMLNRVEKEIKHLTEGN